MAANTHDVQSREMRDAHWTPCRDARIDQRDRYRLHTSNTIIIMYFSIKSATSIGL
jgi:hypothetical protein